MKFNFLLIFLAANILFSQTRTTKTYYMSGKVESRISYIDDVLEGKSIWYFESGNLLAERNYSDGKLSGLSREFYSTGLLKSEINYTDGILNGVSKYYYENGSLSDVFQYDFGKLISHRKIENDENYIAPLSAYQMGKVKRNLDNSDFLCDADVCPEPVGGIEEIESNIVYPDLAKQFKLEGAVLVTAKINTKGFAQTVKVNKGLGLGLDEAAIDAVKKTRFIPGEKNGKMVTTEVTFRVKFILDEANGISNNLKSATNENFKSNNESVESQKDFILCELEVCPEPEGGITDLLKKLRYPPNAKRNKISGDVIIEATIDEFGFVVGTEIISGLGYGCDEAAKSALVRTSFSPAMENGKEVSSKIKITIPFILE